MMSLQCESRSDQQTRCASACRNRLRFGLVALLLVFPTTIFAQDEEGDDQIPEVKAEGMEYFRHKLHEAGLQPLSSWNDVLDNPQRTVIVLVGDRSVQQFLNESARTAVQNGAAILIATDQMTGPNLANMFNIHITGDKVDANREDCFRGKSGQGKPFHPFVRPLKAWRGLEEDSPKQMFSQLDGAGDGALATNLPSILRITGKRFPAPEPLAGYPFSAWRGKNENDKLTPENDLFAAGGFYVRGRYLVLADHSIFLNQMLLATSDGTDLLNSNLSFTIDCIDWLKTPNRTRCLFVEDGNIKTDFELKFPDRKDSDLERILKLLMFLEANGNGNRIVEKAEEADLFNAIIGNYFPAREIIRVVLIALITLSILSVFWFTIRNRTTTDPARTLVTPELAAMIPKGDVLRQRFDSLNEVDNVYEAARQLVRDFLCGLNAEPDANGLPPKLLVEDGYEDEAGLRHKLGRLWRIAFDSEPVKVAPEQWTAIKEDLKDVLTDADDGWWKFTKRIDS